MKTVDFCKYIFSIMCLLLSLGIQAQDVSDSIDVTPGNLRTQLGDRKDLVTDLTLTGSINGDDIGIIRSMAKLTAIDLTNVNIVEGGSYIITDNRGVSRTIKVIKDRIPTAMFYRLSNLTTVIIPISITSIADGTFQESGITSVEIGNNVASIGNEVFLGCENLFSVVINNSVTYLGNAVFEKCEKLSFVILGYGITDLKYRTFAWCYRLTDLDIPNSVTSIGSYAFMNCIGLTSIIIPDRVYIIADNAFNGCYSMNEIHCAATTPPMANFETFSGINFNLCRLYVPRGTSRAYRNALGWSDFANIIEEEPPLSFSAPD